MFGHIMDKWDSYLSVLLGIFLVVAATASLNAQLLLYFKYYVFAMVGVAAFDTFKNFGEHESIVWKLAAIISNATVVLSCIIILQQMFKMLTTVSISSLPFLTKLMAMPSFMLYLGIFLIVENAMWIYVYDHF